MIPARELSIRRRILAAVVRSATPRRRSYFEELPILGPVSRVAITYSWECALHPSIILFNRHPPASDIKVLKIQLSCQDSSQCLVSRAEKTVKVLSQDGQVCEQSKTCYILFLLVDCVIFSHFAYEVP